MYNEWPLIEVNALFEESKWSVLHKLPYVNGQNIVNSVVRPLAGNLKSGQAIGRDSHTPIAVNENVFTDQEQAANYLRTDRDVQWVMEVVCFGLSLPLNTTEQHEALRDCVNIYCEWIHALIPNESAIKVIPSPVLNDPNQYFRRIIQHLYNVFLLRTNSNYSIHSPSPSPDLNPNDIISRQAMLCHRVLRTIASITQDETNVMDRETWELLLLFLLAINNSLLAPPTDKDDIGRAKLCERVVGVLFEIWTIACSKYFPNPSFWKTFHHLCCSWRHQPALIDQWSRVCLIFTQRLLQLTYNVGSSTCVSDSLSTIISTYCIQMVNKMSKETVSEAWYKLLNTIGNPVDLHSPSIISKTCKFHHYTSESLVDPRQHPCLNELPLIFFKAMKGLSMLVDTFLGLPFEFEIEALETESTKSMNSSISSGPSIVPMPRKHSSQKSAASGKVVQKKSGLLLGKPPKTSQLGGSSIVTSQSSHTAQSTIPTSRFVRPLTFSQSKPKVNSILNVLGNWLFNACMIATKFYSQTDNFDEGVERSTSSASFGSSADQSRKSSVGAGSDRISLEVSSSLLPENFEGGQSEAIGALCRLFSSKRTDEEISSVYLARFYLALQHGLSVRENTRGQVMSSILLNGTKLFQINLNGINILLPDFLKAMEMIIIDSEQETKINFIAPITELRRACIKLLLSMISYPLHFDGLPIKDSLTDSSSFTFRSLRPRILNLMINALKTEQDSLNVQMLLSSFLICIQESYAYEKEMPNKNTSSLDSMSYENKESSQAEPPNTVEHFTTHQQGRTPTLSASFQGRGDIPDTARDIYSRTLNLVCQLLANTWKNDTQVSLAALETLVGMARVKFAHTDHESILTFTEESKLVTKWICDFIIYQCSRPPPHHSKDMHSTIVASYQCLNVWFHEHSYLLSDRDCINYLMDVIELGISGSKSRSGSGYTLKAQKELKPASMRVREAAESLLTCLMNHFGNCPSAPCPPEMVTGCCLLDETSIMKSLGVDVDTDPSTNWSKYFKYFVVENSILLAIVDHPSAKRSICIIRSAFGKYCWSMKFQVIPSKGSPRPSVENVPRPVPHRGSTSKRNIVPRFFPESLDKIPLTKLDTVVPSLSQIIKSNSKLKSDHDKMVKMVEKQALDERELEKRCLPLILFSECKPPKPKEDMECSRLILSHLGFLSLESNSKQSDTTTCTNSLIYLDPKSVDLLTDIRALDMISTRTSDTGFIFYVRKGRVHPQEILNSVSSKHYVSSQFIDFLSSLGCSMKVSQHFGWTGNVFTSWKYKAEDTSTLVQDPIDEHGGSAYDGHRMALYWADVCHEIAFIVPSGRYPEEDSISLDSESKGRTKSTEGSETHMDIRSLSSLSDDGMSNSSLSRNLSEPESSRNSWRRKNKQLSFVGNIGCDTKILIIWLESLEDEPAIPISSLLLMTNTGVETNMCNRKDYIAILIHPFKNDLFAVRITSSLPKLPLGLPLIDGMVVSKRVLGFATRTTCLNLCRRRRLDAESFQPPHVKRRLKVQEMAKKYKIEGSDFYYSLFT